ncbi:hypothetical protein ACTFIU_003312 [Dictyostelium citrinum]
MFQIISSYFTKNNNEINEEKQNKGKDTVIIDYTIDENKSLLFYKIWHNIILKNKILLENRLFSTICNHRVSFNNLNQLIQYPHKEKLFFIKFNEALSETDLILFKESIPPSVEIIYLPPKLNRSINSNLIPNQVHTVYLNYDYRFPLENKNQISKSIKNLYVFSFKRHQYLIDIFNNSKYNKLINVINDDGQIKFTFNNNNNNEDNGEGLIINNDKKVQLSHHEGTIIEIGFIPCSFQTIVFSLNFNQNLIGGYLPPGVKKLKFVGPNSPFSIKPYSIPESVTYIHFTKSSKFNETIEKNCFPKNLKRFEMSDFYRRSIKFPPSLTRLSIGKDFNHFPITKILSNDGNGLEFLDLTRAKFFNGNWKDLSKSIKTLSLTLHNFFGGSFEHRDFIPLNFISKVSELYLHDIKLSPYNYFTLKAMPPNYFPQSVTSLHFIDCSVVELNQIHSNITTLSLPNQFNQSLISLYHSNVEHLSLGSQFNQDLSLPKSLPNSLISLNIGSSNSLSNDNITIDHLPSTLTTIKTFNTNSKFLNSNLLNSLLYSQKHTVKIIKRKY